MNKAQIIWNELISPNMRLVKDKEGEVIGYVCESFYLLEDEELDSYLQQKEEE